jgi:hypothetical protein
MSNQEKTVWINTRTVRVNPRDVPSSTVSGKLNMPQPIPIEMPSDEVLKLGNDMMDTYRRLSKSTPENANYKLDGILQEDMSGIIKQQLMAKEIP